MTARLMNPTDAELIVTIIFLIMSFIVVFSPNKVSYYTIDNFDIDIYWRAAGMNVLVCAIKGLTVVVVTVYMRRKFRINPVLLLDFNVQKQNKMLIMMLCQMTILSVTLMQK